MGTKVKARSGQIIQCKGSGEGEEEQQRAQRPTDELSPDGMYRFIVEVYLNNNLHLLVLSPD